MCFLSLHSGLSALLIFRRLSEGSRTLVRMSKTHRIAMRSGRPSGRSYPGAMTVSAHDVSAELRRRLPSVGTKKLHKLLYYCQGHHLAVFGEPLFTEPVAAWDMGPVVERLWRDERYGLERPPTSELDEASLNTLGYVLSRYGALTGRDLEVMTHGEPPWLLANAARRPRDRTLIRPEWMVEYFRSDGAADDGLEGGVDDVPLDSAAVSAWLRECAAQDDGSPYAADSLEALRAWAGRG